MIENRKGVENTTIWIIFLVFSLGMTGFLLWEIHQFKTMDTHIQYTFHIKEMNIQKASNMSS